MSALRGFGFAPAMTGLVVARLGLLLVSSLPAALAAHGSLQAGAARSPWFTEATRPLPVMQLVELPEQVSARAWWLLVVGVVASFVALQLLSAAALAQLGPEPVRPRLWPAFWRLGAEHLWAFLRVALLAAGFQLLGAIGLFAGYGAATKALDSGWDSLRLSGLLGGLLLLWASLVGGFAHWCRVVLVADERRHVRRVVPIVLTLFWRRPAGTWLLHVVIHATSVLLGAGLLIAWRQAADGRPLWAVGCWLGLAVQAYLWCALQRAGRLVYAEDRWEELRQTPDAPFAVWSRLRQRFSRRPAQ